MAIAVPADQAAFVQALREIVAELETEPSIAAVGGRSSVEYARHIDAELLARVADLFEQLCLVP